MTKRLHSFTRFAPYLLALAAGCAVFIYNFLNYSQPASLNDEMGYLTKAATFAGHSVDMSSSWYGGYSLLLSPIFRVFSDPSTIWIGVLALNAVFWTAVVLLIGYMLKQAFPSKAKLSLTLVALVACMYPGFFGMSGHAFATTTYVFVIVSLAAAVMKSGLTKPWFLLLAAMLAGFAAWVHPTGIVVLGVFAALMVLKAIAERSWLWIALVALALGLGGTYLVIVHPWLNSVMTTAGFEISNHYNASSRVLGAIGELSFWKNLVSLVIGQTAYLLIATFGLLAVAFDWLMSRAKYKIKNLYKIVTKDSVSMAGALLLLITIGLIVLGAIFFSPMPKDYLRADQWIYGRYAEVSVVALVAVGLLAKWRAKVFLYAGGFLLGAALWFMWAVGDFNTKMESFHVSNIMGFWPALFTDTPNYALWFAIGAAALVLMALAAKWGRKWLVIVVAAPLLFMQLGAIQSYWRSYTQDVNGFVEFVRDNYPSETCLGYAPSDGTPGQRLRFNLYAFQLHDYDLRRVQPERWVEDCGDLFLTHSPEKARQVALDNNGVIIAREQSYNLYIVAPATSIPESIDTSNYVDFYFNPADPDCVANGCFDWQAGLDQTKTSVGEIKDHVLVADGEPGAILHGPYGSLQPGKYQITLNADIPTGQTARLELITKDEASGEIKYLLKTQLQPGTEHIASFNVKELAEDIQVRVYVEKESSVQLKSYRIDSL